MSGRRPLGAAAGLAATAALCLAAARLAPAARSYGSDRPILEPRLFGEGVISTPFDEFGGQFSADGRTLFFSRSVPRFYLDTILVSRFAAGRWSEPEVAPFAGVWRDYDPVLSADGARLFFISDRPRSGGVSQGYNIWYLEKTAGGGWSEPRDLGAPVNGVGDAHFASTALDGTLYFTSHRPGNLGYVDVYRSRWVGGHYTEPENLGPAINGPEWSNFEAFVTPAGDELLVAAFGHRDGFGDCDLYVSFLEDGVWSPLQNLGPKINSAARDYTPRITPHGRYLTFTSERGLPDAQRTRPFTHRELVEAMHGTLNGLGNLYLVDASILPRRPAKAGGPKDRSAFK